MKTNYAFIWLKYLIIFLGLILSNLIVQCRLTQNVFFSWGFSSNVVKALNDFLLHARENIHDAFDEDS